MHKRVVVTGLGVVSSIGIGRGAFWSSLIRGVSGISKVELFDTSKFNRHYGGEIKDFRPEEFIRRGAVKFLGRASCFAIAAARLALEDAGISLIKHKDKKIGVIIGTTLPEGNAVDLSSEMLLKGEFDSIPRNSLFNVFSPGISRNVGRFFRAKGINLLLPNACAAGNYSIGCGFDLINKGEISLAIVGGSEALSRIAFQGFLKLYAMAPEICSPFSKGRQGMLLGEGAGVLILESMERAVLRGAPIYAEVLGYGLSCDAHSMTIPKREGIRKAMQKAVNNSGISVDGIDYISAHGTGTTQNDQQESGAIRDLFKGRSLPVSSIKSMLGHCMGAASSIEAIACCLALKEGVLPPTINFQESDPECDIDCVPNQAREVKVKKVLNNGFAFGGNNCCVVFASP